MDRYKNSCRYIVREMFIMRHRHIHDDKSCIFSSLRLNILNVDNKFVTISTDNPVLEPINKLVIKTEEQTQIILEDQEKHKTEIAVKIVQQEQYMLDDSHKDVSYKDVSYKDVSHKDITGKNTSDENILQSVLEDTLKDSSQDNLQDSLQNDYQNDVPEEHITEEHITEEHLTEEHVPEEHITEEHLTSEDDASSEQDLIKQSSRIQTREEKELEQAVCAYQQGDESTFEKIYKIYRPKFDRLSFRMKNEDITQELSIALVKAVRTFKTGMPAKFNTYFWKIARNHIGTLNIKNNAKKRTAAGGLVSLNQVMNIDGAEIEFGDLIEDETALVQFESATFGAFLSSTILPYMKETDKNALLLYLKGYTLDEIGRRLGGMSAPAIHVKIKQLKSRDIIYRSICKYFGDQGYDVQRLKSSK